MHVMPDCKAALYMRLSKEDDSEAESQSVANQRSLLRSFAKEHSLDVYGEYVEACDIIEPTQETA